MEETVVDETAYDAEKKQILKINKIEYSDIWDSLSSGIADFRRETKYGLALGGFYALGGMFLVSLLYVFDLPYLFYPLTTGFALVAPIAAAGFYEISRRLEIDEPLTWSNVLGAMRLCCGKDLAYMAVITGFSLIVWVDFAVFVYLMFFGLKAMSLPQLVETVLTTPAGLAFLLVGNAFGALFALTVFSLTAVSFPMLYDRDVDFVTAMITSVKSVMKNFAPMVLWLAIIGLSLIVSIATLFVGLFITLPILGHATWHVYRKLIAAEEAAQ